MDGPSPSGRQPLPVTGLFSRMSQFRNPHVSIRNNNPRISNSSPNMKKIVVTATSLALAAMFSSAGSLEPKHLAVLRAGDGRLDLKLRQSPIFIDEFVPGNFNPAPATTIALPTNGPNAFF